MATPAVVGYAGEIPEAPIETTLCEVIRDPAKFNDKVVRFRATVIPGFEATTLKYDGCSTGLPFGRGENYMNAHLGEQYAFVPANRIRQVLGQKRPAGLKWRRVSVPHSITPKRDDFWKEFNDYLAKEYSPCPRKLCPMYEVTATLTGRLDHSESSIIAFRSSRSGGASYHPAGFGHLNGSLSQLVLVSVSEVVAKPIDRSVYENKSPE